MNQDAKKTALRMIPYGIYVLTADDGKGHIAAATVNWVTQTAFAPPLVVVGVKADAASYQTVKAARSFALNMLGKDQKPLAFTFFRPAEVSEGKLSGQGYHTGATGAPILNDVPAALRKAGRYFADLRRVDERRRGAVNDEVFRAAPPGRYPRYFLQNFHYQTDGYLSRRSAELYDHQVEVLFGGGAEAMRRQALVPLKRVVEALGVRRARLLDLACGTGRFLRAVKSNYPRLAVTALDLSPFYLDEARRVLAPWSRVEFVAAPAERVPCADRSFDVATAIFLFHELPARERRQVAREMARLLRPGGVAILVDSIQLGDVPDYDALVEYFPLAFHEPYYAQYAREDLATLFADAGLALDESGVGYLSKVMVFSKRR